MEMTEDEFIKAGDIFYKRTHDIADYLLRPNLPLEKVIQASCMLVQMRIRLHRVVGIYTKKYTHIPNFASGGVVNFNNTNE